MAQQPQQPAAMNSIVTVKRHEELKSIKQSEFAEKAADVLRDADRGVQTTLRADDGTVVATVGLNGHRFFPDPTPDPLDAILQLALSADKIERK